MEAEIQKQILAYLKKCPNVKVWRTNAGHVKNNLKLGPPGIPDIIGYVTLGRFAGKFIGFEVKAPGGKLRPTQTRWMAEMRAAGAHYYTVSDIEGAKAIYQAYYES